VTLSRKTASVAAAIVAALLAAAPVLAQVPLPRPRPADLGKDAAAAALEALLNDPDLARIPEPDPPGIPSPCQTRMTERIIAIFQSLPALKGARNCGSGDIVKLETVILPDNSRVAVSPPATMRCTMAEAVSHWVRDEIAPVLAKPGVSLRALDNYASYDCRGRNNIVGARTSEHGFANALDIRGVRLTDGKFMEFTDRRVARDLREGLRKLTCGRFTTVLGPGSDGYHEDHIHVDLAERRNGYRLCQWAVLDPLPDIPLPRPRPPEAPKAEPEAE
jgi:hypothetical protein